MHAAVWQASARAKCPPGLDMSVSILTSGYWPSYPVLEAKLPEELTQHQAVFKDFYLSKHSGRRLVWHNSLGTCNVKARFAKGTKELALSLFQVRAHRHHSLPCCSLLANLLFSSSEEVELFLSASV